MKAQERRKGVREWWGTPGETGSREREKEKQENGDKGKEGRKEGSVAQTPSTKAESEPTHPSSRGTGSQGEGPSQEAWLPGECSSWRHGTGVSLFCKKQDAGCSSLFQRLLSGLRMP